jgi:hypothetical protein
MNKKKLDFFVFFRTYLNSDFRRFFGVETEVTRVASCWEFSSVFIDVVDIVLKLLCRTMSTRADDEESTLCKYAVVSIGFPFNKLMWNSSMMFYMIENSRDESSSFLREIKKKKKHFFNYTNEKREWEKEKVRIPYGSLMMNERPTWKIIL